MEIFMRNIPIEFHREYDLKVSLSKHLHGENFPNIKANFHLHLFRPKRPDVRTCSGTFTLADLHVAERFLQIYGGSFPRQTIKLGHKSIYFQKSRSLPQRELLELLSRSRWVDPADELEQLKRSEQLSSACLPIQAVQFGWMCRDRVFSVEGEEQARPCYLVFDPDRSEIHLTFPRTSPHANTHIIAIRQTSTLSVSAHRIGEKSVVCFQLEIPPLFLRRKYDDKPFYRMSALPFKALHPQATPFISLAIRVVFSSSKEHVVFLELAKTAGLRQVQTFQITTEHRRLFTAANLHRLKSEIRALEWNIAFQLEAMLHNLDLDATELLAILPRIKSHAETRGSSYVANLLRTFAGKVRGLSCINKNTVEPVLACLEESHCELTKQTALDSHPMAEGALYHSFHVRVTPTTMHLTGPFLEKSNRVIRRYQKAHQENFLRVEFREEDGLQYRFDRDVNGRKFIQDRLGPLLKERLVVAGREFQFLAYSQSALREHSVWFCRPFIDAGLGEMDAAKIIQSLGTFDGLEYDPELIYCPARYAARLSQAFTTTEAATIKVRDEDMKMIKDVVVKVRGKVKYTFTDGSGNMSEDLAREVWKNIGPKGCSETDDFPRAYQIRLGGSKGMISVDYKLNGSRAIALRPSMIKFDVPKTKEETMEIEIARAIVAPTPYHLNRQLIMLLEGLGVRVEEIQRYQDQAVKDTQNATRSLHDAATLFETHGLGSSFRLATVLRNLEKLGIEDLPGDPFYDQLLQVSVYHVLRDLKNHARIPIPNAWTLVGVADTHGFLEENEIFACIKKPDGETIYLEGSVLVSRSPLIHPGDVQVAIARGRPPSGSPFEQEPLQNTVVFSTQGKRPLPSCLGGGDLDGDVYNLLPLTMYENLKPLRYFKPAEYAAAERKTLDRPSTMEDVADFVMEYINSDVIGLIANNWLIIADQSQFGIQDRVCLKLAKLHSDAVDYPKTGNAVNVAELPKLKFPRPDWSAPETVEPDPVNYYQSQSAVGILSRAIDLNRHNPSLPTDTFDHAMPPTQDNQLMKILTQRVSHHIGLGNVAPNSLIESSFAWFCDEVLHVASECSLSHRHSRPLHEAEIITGTITQKTSQPRMRKDKISKMRELTDSLVRRVRWLLEGDESKSTKDQLRDAWLAWNLSLNGERGKRFGARAFGWVALGGILDALQVLEEASSQREVVYR